MLVNMVAQEKEDQVKSFLHWLRQVRNNYDVRFVICGSIGIDQIVRNTNSIPALNDLQRVNVGPFSREAAIEFIGELLKSYDIKPDGLVANSILEEIGIPIPYFIQIFIQTIAMECKQRNLVPSKELVTRIYQESLLGRQGKFYLEHYYNRLKLSYPGDQGIAARRILDHVAITGGCDRENLYNVYSAATETNDQESFNDLLQRLEDDFYISRDEEHKTYDFSSKLLKDVWVKRLGK